MDKTIEYHYAIMVSAGKELREALVTAMDAMHLPLEECEEIAKWDALMEEYESHKV